MGKVLTFIIIALAWHSGLAQENSMQRRLIALSFINAFRAGSLSNEQMVKQYLAEGCYFKSDSIRQLANAWMDAFRKNVQRYTGDQIEVVSYAGNEEAFMVMDNPPGQPLSAPVRQRLLFSLDTPAQKHQAVDTNNLFVLKVDPDDQSKYLFILFDDNNRIISFLGLQFGKNVGLWHW